MKAKDLKSVYEENPELKEVGTATQYYKYLKTIFPESKVQDIVWHGSRNKENLLSQGSFEKRKSKQFDYFHGGIFATSSKDDAETSGTGKGQYGVVSLLINLRNPGISKQAIPNIIDYDTWRFGNKKELEYTIKNTNWKKK